MKILLALLLFFSSCSVEEKFFNSSTDYITQDGHKYIQSIISGNKGVINNLSENQFIIKNKEVDTLYIFSTVLDNENMFYSGKNLQIKGGTLIVDTHYAEYMADAVHSGIKKFSFIQLLPKDSLVINIDVNRLPIQKTDYSAVTLKLIYYYFEKRGQNFDGLVNIERSKLFINAVYEK